MPASAVTYEFLSPGRGVAPGGATARVHAALREAIVQLDFRPGEFLDKQAIAARMGVSRFPVGEAMNRLAAEGLVDIVPQSGSRVALIKISDARENMFFRRALEVETVRTIAGASPSALHRPAPQQSALPAGRHRGAGPQGISRLRPRLPCRPAGPAGL
jgi:GntR family transcriptional regulator, rspAB operon transcriptional repressor